MKVQILSATLFTAFSGVLSAADPQLLNLLMPDAKVIAGVNVEQAKGTPFGQYILNQVQSHDADMQKLIQLTGFDPRRDVREVLVASNGSSTEHTGIALARGSFDGARILTLATAHGAATEDYQGVAIIEDPKPKGVAMGIAFLDSTTVVAGDLANVKAAIDRRSAAQPLPAALLVKINQWSTAQDAWGISAVPPSTLAPADKNTQPNPVFTAAQNVQQAAAGVKFGANVALTSEAICDTAQNCSTLGDLVKFMVNLAQMQTGQNPEAKQLVSSVQVNAAGNTLKVTASLPQDIMQKMLAPAKKVAPLRVERRGAN